MFKVGAELRIDGKLVTLLRKLDDDIWQIEDNRSKRITELTMAQLHSIYLSGNLIFADRLPVLHTNRQNARLPEAQIRENDWETAKIRRLYVLAILALPNGRAEIERAVTEVWARLKTPDSVPGYVTAYRWKRRYVEAGNDIRALLPRHAQKGNTQPRYPDEVISIVSDTIDDRYLSLERSTIQATLEQAVERVIQENALRPASMQLPRPTRRLVRRMIDAIPAFDRYAARHGRTAAMKRFRSVQAHRTTAAPLERAEIDHTPLDLMVIDDDSGLPLGRPYITACIDDYTRCVLGLYISFEPPSHFTVSRCLKQAFLPKTGVLQNFPAIKSFWDAHGVMRDLVVDNGQEFHSTSLENACYSLGIEMHYSARKTPWFKGKIERFLGTLNRAIAHGTPGTTFSNIFDKEDYDSSKFAVVKYSTLKEIVFTWIVDVYHQQVHRALGVPPAIMWTRSIEPEDILVPDDPFRLDFILGRSEERVLSHKGIELYGLHFNSPELTMLRRNMGDKLNVEVRVDASDLGHIIVLSPNKSEAFKVPCLQLEYATGLSEWQHRVCKRFAAQEMNAYSPRVWLDAKARIRQLIKDEFMQKKQRTRNKIARYKNMDATSSLPASATAIEPPSDLLPEPAQTLSVSAMANPLTPDDVAGDQPAARSRRIAPLFRKRTPAAIAAEQDGHSRTNID